MAARNLSYATNTEQLQDAIFRILKQYRGQGWYIVDRNKCINFGSIFQDGVASYSNIDLFCERIFNPKAITTLNKEVFFITDEEQKTVQEYNDAMARIQLAASDPSAVSEEELIQSKEAVERLEPIISAITPSKKELPLPFYVNALTKEEFPVVELSQATEEAIKAWADEVARFVEVTKLAITPAAFSPHQQPNGLSVMKVKAPLWTDIVVR